MQASPHTLTSEWIVMTNARVFHNNESTPSLLTVSIALLQNLVGREEAKMLKILNICLLLTRLQTFIVLLCAYEYVKNLIFLYTLLHELRTICVISHISYVGLSM